MASANADASKTVTADLSWHNYTLVFPSSGNVIAYLDGASLGTATYSPTPTPSGIDATLIGGLVYSGSTLYGTFGGAIDFPAVWSCALSAGEVASFYVNPLQVLCGPTPAAVMLGGRR